MASKYLNNTMPAMQIAFLRFFFGVISLVPFMLYYGKAAFYTSRIYMHFSRGAILFLAISIWIYSLTIVPIVVATLTTFIIPLFILIMAPIFLKEKIQLSLVLATIVGFLGVILILEPQSIDFNPYSLLMVLSAFLFATLDVLNKKFVANEGMLGMLFYSAIVTTMLAAYPAYQVWKIPVLRDILICAYLGIGSNLILLCLLKTFSLVKASSVSPYRYLELLFSGLLGIVFFGEIPTSSILIGAAVIIPTTLFITYQQTKSGQS